ncbi:MAG: hypothetical protein HUU19_05375 [Phycisphaerales bacterium]|nr:hypothetical protein [Phycisphaerales bacterium]
MPIANGEYGADNIAMPVESEWRVGDVWMEIPQINGAAEAALSETLTGEIVPFSMTVGGSHPRSGDVDWRYAANKI